MRAMFIAVLIYAAFGIYGVNAKIYYTTDNAGNVTRHTGDTPYPAGAIWQSRCPRTADERTLSVINGIVVIDPVKVNGVQLIDQATKPDKLKAAENKFFDLCLAIFGDRTKRGFDELNTAIEALTATDPNTATALAIRLLAVDAECKREGGNQWWDTAAYHEEIVE